MSEEKEPTIYNATKNFPCDGFYAHRVKAREHLQPDGTWKKDYVGEYLQKDGSWKTDCAHGWFGTVEEIKTLLNTSITPP